MERREGGWEDGERVISGSLTQAQVEGRAAGLTWEASLAQGWESDWSSFGPRWGFHVPGETQEGGHWPCPSVKVDGDSRLSCGQVEPRSCFGRNRSISTRFQLNREGGQSPPSLVEGWEESSEVSIKKQG